MFCEYCGSENPDDATFCGECGKKLEKINVNKKNTALAMVISFFLTGLGIAYAGNIKKGLILFVLAIIFSILGFGMGIFSIVGIIIWVYGLYETYNEVKRANGESNPNLIEDWKRWDSSKKAISAVVAIVIVLIVIGTVASALTPKTHYSDYDDYDTYSSSSVDLDDSDLSSSSSGDSYSSSSNGRDVSSHYEGDSGSADTYGTIYDDGSVESHQKGHTDYGDYQIDSYMDSDGNMHGTVDVGGRTYHVSS